MSMHEKLQNHFAKQFFDVNYLTIFCLMLFTLLPISAKSALQQSMHTAGHISPRDNDITDIPYGLPLDTDYPVFDTRQIYFALDSLGDQNYASEGHKIFLDIFTPSGDHWIRLPYDGGSYTIDNTNSKTTACGIRSWIGSIPVAGTLIQNFSLLGKWKVVAYEVGASTPLATGFFNIVQGTYTPSGSPASTSECILTVTIDIKPGSYPNSINLGASGVIPVAILSSDTFNAVSEVNPDSLNLAGAKVRVAGKSNRALCHEEDVNSDNLNDLVCQFENELQSQEGDSTAVLEGNTFSGVPIRGENTIRIVP